MEVNGFFSGDLRELKGFFFAEIQWTSDASL